MTTRLGQPTSTDLPRCCGRCGYDLRGTPLGHDCPECGAPPDDAIPDPRLRGRWRSIAAVAYLSLLCTAVLILTLTCVYLTDVVRLPRLRQSWMHALSWRLEERAFPVALLTNLLAVPFLALAVLERRLHSPAFARQRHLAKIAACAGAIVAVPLLIVAMLS